MMNWKKWFVLCVALLFCLTAMVLPAVATSTQPATEPVPEPAAPNAGAIGLLLGIGAVLLVATWGMVIWLMRRVVR